MSKAILGRRRIMDGLPLFPLLTLFLINFFDEFDSAAFAVLTPNIRREFGLTTAEITGIVVVSIVFTTFFVLLVGYVADRFKRTRLVAISALLATLASVGTGLAGAVWVLVMFRFANGIGRLFTDPVHSSLLSDYYPAERRGEVFSIHRSANQWGNIAAPAFAGLVGGWIGWRGTFPLLAAPAFAAASIAFFLKEPLRGQTEDRQSAQEAAKEPPIPFARGFRMLSHIRTLRRVWLSNFFLGAGLLPLLPVFALFWEDVFDVGTRGRGFIATGGAIAGLAGVLLGGPITRLLLKRGPHLCQLFAGLMLVAAATALFGVAAAKSLPVALTFFLVTAFGLGVREPPFITVTSIIIPPRIRSLGFAYSPLFLSIGAVLAAPLAGIADVHGFRWALSAFAPVLIFAGLVFASGFRFVSSDQLRAIKTLEVEAKLREERMQAGVKSLLVCRGLDVSYDLMQVLYDVEFEVKEGEILALLGTNGAGKSTLLRAISGLMHPDAGVVFFDGRDITFYEPEETARAGIVLSPGGRALFPGMTVRECLLAATWMARRSPAEVRRRIDRVLHLFPKLEERLDQDAGTMSGGEQQMLTLAQAMESEPKLLMIDELTLGLAPKVVSELLDSIRAINAEGVTIILVEQSVNIAVEIADRAYFLERGQIRFTGRASELLERGDLLRSVFIKGDAELHR